MKAGRKRGTGHFFYFYRGRTRRSPRKGGKGVFGLLKGGRHCAYGKSSRRPERREWGGTSLSFIKRKREGSFLLPGGQNVNLSCKEGIRASCFSILEVVGKKGEEGQYLSSLINKKGR